MKMSTKQMGRYKFRGCNFVLFFPQKSFVKFLGVYKRRDSGIARQLAACTIFMINERGMVS